MADIGFLNLLGHTINVVSGIYILGKILKEKINLKDYSLYIYTFLLIFLSIFSSILVAGYIRILISTFLITIYGKMLFKRDLGIAFIGSVLEEMTMFLSELLLMLIIIIIFGLNTEFLFENVQCTFLINVAISSLGIILCNLNFVKKGYDKLLSFMPNMRRRHKYSAMILIIITLNVLLMIFYFNTNDFKLLLINVCFIGIYCLILYFSLNEKSENIKFKIENQTLMDNLHIYEDMLDYQRVSNHENKNQLLVIKNMIRKNDKEIIEYIDEVIKDKREDNETLLTFTKKLPSGGLQGIVYQKLLIMEEHNIKMEIAIEKGIKDIKMNSKLNYDVCRIVGIFLDNAIEETIKVNNKNLTFSLFCDNDYLVIEISNFFKELPDISKLELKGYSTKGNERGYGLFIVKEIVEKNSDLFKETHIIKNIFCQQLKIKM